MMIPSIFVGLLCPLFVLCIVVAIIIAVVRAMRGRGPTTLGGMAQSPLNVITQPADDGFWMQCGVIDPDAVVFFQYWANGVRHSGQVPNQPGADGRQFVYTGLRPEQVVIVRIVESADDDIVSPVIVGPVIDVSSPIWTAPDPSIPAPPQFPTAY